MSAMPCPRCERETGDGLLCFDCVNRCIRNLRTIADLWPAMFERRPSSGSEPVKGSRDLGLRPLAERTRKVLAYVGNQLMSWVVDLGGEDQVRDDPTDWCDWLVRHVVEIRAHEASDEIVAEFGYCRGLVYSVVDLPPDRLYCGICDMCGHGLYAKDEASEILCKRCEKAGVVTIPVSAKVCRDRMRADLEDMLVSRDEVLRAVPMMFGVEIKRGTLDSWLSRGRLTEVGGRVRVGDVLDLAHGMAQRMTEVRRSA